MYRQLGARVTLDGQGVCVSECICVFVSASPFVLQMKEGCGRRGSFLLSQTHGDAGRATAVRPFD